MSAKRIRQIVEDSKENERILTQEIKRLKTELEESKRREKRLQDLLDWKEWLETQTKPEIEEKPYQPLWIDFL